MWWTIYDFIVIICLSSFKHFIFAFIKLIILLSDCLLKTDKTKCQLMSSLIAVIRTFDEWLENRSKSRLEVNEKWVITRRLRRILRKSFERPWGRRGKNIKSRASVISAVSMYSCVAYVLTVGGKTNNQNKLQFPATLGADICWALHNAQLVSRRCWDNKSRYLLSGSPRETADSPSHYRLVFSDLKITSTRGEETFLHIGIGKIRHQKVVGSRFYQKTSFQCQDFD